MNRSVLCKFDNTWYSPGKGCLMRLLWYITNECFFNCGWNISSGLKNRLLRYFGAKVGQGVIIKPHVNIKYPWRLTVGDNVWIGENVWIDNLGNVVIGNNVCLSQGAMLLCGNHNYKKSAFDLIVGDICIEDGSWAGAKSVVCPGVTLHSHSVLGVGSVANHDLDPYSIYQGNPAVKIRERKIEE